MKSLLSLFFLLTLCCPINAQVDIDMSDMQDNDSINQYDEIRRLPFFSFNIEGNPINRKVAIETTIIPY